MKEDCAPEEEQKDSQDDDKFEDAQYHEKVTTLPTSTEGK